MQYEFIFKAIMEVLLVGAVALLFKNLVSSIEKNMDRLEKSWEKYTDKLTLSINNVHQDLSKVKQDVEVLGEEVSQIRSTLHRSGGYNGKELSEECG